MTGDRISQKIGYARSGGLGLSLEAQRIALAQAGCDPIFVEVADSGDRGQAYTAREQALDALRSGGSLFLTSLDRLGHSLVDIAALIERIFDIGAELRVLDDGLDTSNQDGARPTLMALARAQSALVSERAHDSLARRRDEGNALGPPRRLRDEHWPEIEALIAAEISVADIAQRFGVTRQTLWNFRRRMERAAANIASEPPADG
ncbi:recombinase family protein [Sphingomonas crocodyli]|uniref:recombinase family protein n=1 Tax=Sphingomonas crocodyli TaxID=1979270 RepID=UPI0013E335D2|nr:recombinase family protein [Sphingomonas crocodyli]